MRTIIELDAAGLRAHADELAEVLRDCVLNGASVGFELPFPEAEALAFWLGLVPAVERRERRLFAVRDDAGVICGTVQLVLAGMPNGRHRAEIAKMLVHSRMRRQGIAQALMLHAEAIARTEQRSLIVLDTCTGYGAEQMYLKLGYQECGIIPQYATMPDGTLGATTFMYKLLPRVAAEDPEGDDAAQMIEELNVTLKLITGDSGRTLFSADDVRGPSARFAVARDAQGRALGCGAFRPLAEGVAEVKRIYARDGSRGIGSAILSWLEAEARALGYRALRLETRVVNSRAVSFYMGRGYARIPNFGHYAGNDAAACFEKQL
ncbi:GNAT family N-acetyltransferase [Pseudoduganella sp. RAF19]|uniref:GNAT family N-acetyltransferase n=1 Tax=Pseudoduganella sp. RAF19 TaxID=3233052 RepID=UPI003F9518EB